jgi:transcription initiation factor IIE alpha subunit
MCNRIKDSDAAMICAAFKHGEATREELAETFGYSKTSIRNILADEGLIRNIHRKTPKQKEILDYLESKGVTCLDHLKKIL